MMTLKEKSMTKLGLVVTFAVLMGACTSKSIKMEASEMALETGDTEQVEVGEGSQVSNDGYIELAGPDTTAYGKTAKKAKGLKSKKSVAKNFKKTKKSFVAKNKATKNKPQISAAATVALDQELSQYPSMDNMNGIAVPAPMEEASMVEESTGRAFWMYVLAGFLIVIAAGGYVYKTRFSKAKSRRRLVYNG